MQGYGLRLRGALLGLGFGGAGGGREDGGHCFHLCHVSTRALFLPELYVMRFLVFHCGIIGSISLFSAWAQGIN